MEELQSAAKDALEWLDANSASDVGVDAVQDKLKEVEAVVNPIMSKLYQDSGGAEARPEPNPRPLNAAGHTGSIYRCGKRTVKEQPVGYGGRKGAEIRPKTALAGAPRRRERRVRIAQPSTLLLAQRHDSREGGNDAKFNSKMCAAIHFYGRVIVDYRKYIGQARHALLGCFVTLSWRRSECTTALASWPIDASEKKHTTFYFHRCCYS